MVKPTDPPKPSVLTNLLFLLIIVCLLTLAVAERLCRPPETPLDQERHAQARQEIAALETAVRRHLHDRGALPANLADLVPAYRDAIPADPWGRPYGYERWSDRALIRCYGRNGRARGYGADLDIIATVRKK